MRCRKMHDLRRPGCQLQMRRYGELMNDRKFFIAIICGLIASLLWVSIVAIIDSSTSTTQTLYSATTSIQIENSDKSNDHLIINGTTLNPEIHDFSIVRGINGSIDRVIVTTHINAQWFPACVFPLILSIPIALLWAQKKIVRRKKIGE